MEERQIPHDELLDDNAIIVEEPKEKDLYRVGTLAKIVHVVKNPQGNLSVVFEGISRARIENVSLEAGYLTASVITKKEQTSFKPSTQCDAMIMEIKNLLNNIKNIHPSFDEDMRVAADAITSPAYFADFQLPKSY